MLAADVLVYIKFLNNENNVKLCNRELCVDFGNNLKNFDRVKIQKFRL